MLVVAAVSVLALTAVAIAQTTQENTYSVDGSVTPKKKPGTKKKPVPVSVKFHYTVGEKSNLQPSAIDRYKISFYGVRAVNGDRFPKCTADQISQAGNSDKGCPKGSLVGTGTIDNFVYADSDPSGAQGGFKCTKKLNIYNSGNKKGALFVYGDPNQCGGVGALPPIPAKYVKFGSNGTALQFDVPATVLHPIGGLTVAVTNVTSTIKKQTATVKGKKVGYFESIAKKHPVEVTFVTEAGQKGSAKANA
jgi:hypothetical protein